MKIFRHMDTRNIATFKDKSNAIFWAAKYINITDGKPEIVKVTNEHIGEKYAIMFFPYAGADKKEFLSSEAIK